MSTYVSDFAPSGVTPIVQIINWGGHISLKIAIGELEMTSFMEPLTEEPISDYIQRVIAALGEVKIDYPLTAN